MMTEFLVILGIIAFLVFPVVLIAMISGIKGQVDVLNKRIMQLSQDLKNMAILSTVTAAEPEPVIKVAAEPEPVIKVIAEQLETSVIEATISEPEPVVTEIPITEPEPKPVNTEQIPEPVVQQAPVQETQEEPTYTPQHVQETAKEGFNFERFIGENLINKIGIGVLVIGIGLFVKYAIDNEWLNETARVVVGFLCGGALLGAAYRFRKAYRAFSSVLTGGAIVVF